ncbi:DUF4288 domain-containing protein [Aquipseudomonas alcaligenes]
MNWYAAHIVMQIVLTGRNDVIAWENVVLLHAPNDEDAYSKADAIGHSSEGDSGGTMEWDGSPARMVYRGTRRLASISSPSDVNNNPSDGCEVTYMQLEFDNEEALKGFMNGDGRANLLE